MKELEEEISRRKWKSECLEKFVMFLKELYKYPNHYKRIVIDSDLEDSETGNLKREAECVEYEDTDIRKHLDYVWGIVASLMKCDVCGYDENDKELWFSFYDDSRLGEREIICMSCYKAKWEAEEAK
jgi:hypothetical protein